MTPGPKRKTCCDFCGAPRERVGRLFQSGRGGEPARICDRCVAACMVALSTAAPRPPQPRRTVAFITSAAADMAKSYEGNR
jgi:ClpX C4-type zinc finger